MNWLLLFSVALVCFLVGIRIVRPDRRGVIETLGKYSRLANPGFNWVFWPFQRLIQVNITQEMTNIGRQNIITKDNLNAWVDLLVFYKINDTEDDIRKALYGVTDYEAQIVNFARTAARNVIGNMSFTEVNGMRSKINTDLEKELVKNAVKMGIEIIGVELKELDPPSEVQNAMNSIIIAEKKKSAASDIAAAAKIEASGFKSAAIEKAEGEMRAKILLAEGEAKAIELVSEASKQHFTGAAIEMKKLDVIRETMADNAKLVFIPEGKDITLVLGEGSDKIIPTTRRPR